MDFQWDKQLLEAFKKQKDSIEFLILGIGIAAIFFSIVLIIMTVFLVFLPKTTVHTDVEKYQCDRLLQIEPAHPCKG